MVLVARLDLRRRRKPWPNDSPERAPRPSAHRTGTADAAVHRPPSRKGSTRASRASVRRITCMWVVPGNTASWASGKSSSISAACSQAHELLVTDDEQRRPADATDRSVRPAHELRHHGPDRLHDYPAATEAAVTMEDSWGLTHYVLTATSFGPGSLAAIAAPSRSPPRWPPPTHRA